METTVITTTTTTTAAVLKHSKNKNVSKYKCEERVEESRGA